MKAAHRKFARFEDRLDIHLRQTDILKLIIVHLGQLLQFPSAPIPFREPGNQALDMRVHSLPSAEDALPPLIGNPDGPVRGLNERFKAGV